MKTHYFEIVDSKNVVVQIEKNENGLISVFDFKNKVSFDISHIKREYPCTSTVKDISKEKYDYLIDIWVALTKGKEFVHIVIPKKKQFTPKTRYEILLDGESFVKGYSNKSRKDLAKFFNKNTASFRVFDKNGVETALLKEDLIPRFSYFLFEL